jgi:chemotaxis protein CheC
MSSDPFVPLSDLERDALAELSNIAMAKAANSLRQMIQNEVLLSVPSVEILTNAAATQLVAKPDNPKLVVVRQARLRWGVFRPGDAYLSRTK